MRRLTALSLEWSFRAMVKHKIDWCGNVDYRISENNIGSVGFGGRGGGKIVGLPNSDRVIRDILEIEEMMNFALSNPDLRISHVPIGVDKLDVGSSGGGGGGDDNEEDMFDIDLSQPDPSSSTSSASSSTSGGTPARALLLWLTVPSSSSSSSSSSYELLKTKSAPDRFARTTLIHALGC
jgi:hypothetical protein